MTELEKIAYAKVMIDKLANGINPLDNMPIPDGEIVNNIHLSRCFFFVSDILRRVYENAAMAKPKRVPKIPFALSLEQIEKFEYSDDPIALSEIAKRINGLIDCENMEKITYRHINQWLLNVGMLEYVDLGGKKPVKQPTKEGCQMGISVESRMGYYGMYRVVLYNESAQRFILDNLDAVAATQVAKSRSNSQPASDSQQDETPQEEE